VRERNTQYRDGRTIHDVKIIFSCIPTTAKIIHVVTRSKGNLHSRERMNVAGTTASLKECRVVAHRKPGLILSHSWNK